MWKLIIFKYIAQSCADVHFNYMLSWWFSWCHVQLFTTPWTVALQAPRPWDFPGKNTGVRCHFLLLGIFSTEGSDLHVLHCRQVLSLLSHQANLIHMYKAEFMSFRIDWLDLLAVQGTRQESSPAPQSKSINSSVLSLLYGPALASIHDYWKHHSFDHTDFVCKVILLLLIHCLGLP